MKTQIKMIAVLALLSAPLCAQETWSTEALPGSVSEHAMIRDTNNDRLVVFGGYRNGILSNETWAYSPDNGGWHQLLPGGVAPSPRRESLAAYDADRNRMLVFGGTASTGYTNDTFALDLTPGEERWVELAADDLDKPLARTHGNLIVDTLHDRAILYGGYRSPTMLRDVWALDLAMGDDWVLQATVNHPTGNSIGNAAIYDPIGQRMLVYRAYQSQLAALSLDADLAWTVHTNGTTSVHGRYPAAAYDSARQEMIIHGGLQSNMSSAEAYRIDLDTMNFSQLPSEPGDGRHWHTAAYDELRDRFMIVGGRRYPSVALNTMSALTLLPEAPTDLAPNGETVSGDEVALSWEASAGMVDGHYVVEVYQIEGRETLPQFNVTVSGNSAIFVPDKLEDANDGDSRIYQWIVVAISSNGFTVSSEPAEFEHVHIVPPPADDEVVPPEDGAAATDPTIDDRAPTPMLSAISDRLEGGDAASQTNLGASEPTGTTIVGGGSGERTMNSAGCAGGSGGHGLAVAILLIGIAAAGVRRLRRA